jgi:WD40 repeat protein
MTTPPCCWSSGAACRIGEDRRLSAAAQVEREQGERPDDHGDVGLGHRSSGPWASRASPGALLDGRDACAAGEEPEVAALRSAVDVRPAAVGTGCSTVRALHAGGRSLKAEFDPSGTLVAIAALDGTAQVWDLGSDTPIGEGLTGHDDPVWGVAFNPTGDLLATGADNGTSRVRSDIWNPSAACQLAATYVTADELQPYLGQQPVSTTCRPGQEAPPGTPTCRSRAARQADAFRSR